MKKITHEIEIAGKPLTLSTGDVAQFSNASVLARYGDVMVLATVVVRQSAQDPGYMPLTVEYMERLYAGGRIKGSQWVKREGRPTDEAILSARLIDRSLRPLFPKEYRDEVQIILTVLSVDGENDPAILSAVAASAALALSGAPWNGPIGVVRVGSINGSFVVNPVDSELAFSDLDLIVTSKGDSIIMLEAGANEVPEEKLREAMETALLATKKIEEGIVQFVKKVGVKELPSRTTRNSALALDIEKKYGEDIEKWAQGRATQKTTEEEGTQLRAMIREDMGGTDQEISGAFEEIVRARMRKKLLKGTRPDGRAPTEIRPISAEIGILPRTHGSAIFTRGQTQVLTVTTLGSPSLEQHIESAEGEETKRYIHHYSMPPFATGETGRVGWPSRREIGHGALAERALLPLIPKGEKFPYTIRVVSEILSSNGSTSMASVCGSTLSLMDAGVPITRPVAGIAMGLVIEPSIGSKKETVVVLSDITGIEDGTGDMDFKVAGTIEGVTALQLDVKTKLLTLPILVDAFAQAREGRLFILERMKEALPEPRTTLSRYAPRVVVLHVPTERIGEVIGPGGRVIRKIIAETGAQVEVEDDGTVNISGVADEAVEKAKSIIEGLTHEVKPGEVYEEGEVKRIQPFGAFVEILPGKEGLVHISDLSDEFVHDPSEVVSVGQKVRVRVKEIDELGRINLTMREGEERKVPRPEEQLTEQRRFAPRGGNAPRRSRAPHFPPSRYLPKPRRY